MTTSSSSWRSGNINSGPRWSQAASNSPHQSVASPPPPAAAASVPRTASSNNVVRLPEHDSGNADSVQSDRIMYLLVGLVGNTVVATTRSGIKYVGILSSTTVQGEGTESLGVVLSCAQQVLKDGGLGSLKKMLIIKGEDLDTFSAKDVGLDVPVSMSNANRAGFRTDTEISKKALEPFGEGRLLQKWADDAESLSIEDEAAFADMGSGSGGGGSSKGWDQFAANEARFGVKSNYEETLYTTKLDKSAKDFKDREKKADQLAREIMNSSTSNTHIAEERNMTKEGEEAQTEEDRFGAVVRGPNAYLPPAARRAAAVAAAAGAQNTIRANGNAREEKANGLQQHAGVDIPIITSTPAAPTDATSNGQPSQPDAVGDFRQFVSSERERMEKKKAALAKKEKDNKLADLKNWGDKFKLKFPMSSEGASDKEASDKPRDVSLQKSMSPTTAHLQEQGKKEEEVAGSSSVAASSKAAPSKAMPPANTSASQAKLAETKALLAKMTIPKIPPFNPEKLRAKQSESQASPAATKSSFKLSAKASSFKPFNPNAAAFTPGASAAGAPAPPAALASGSPAPSAGVVSLTQHSNTPSESTSAVASPRPAAVAKIASIAAAATPPANPFFGNRVLKKTSPLHVREDFNPFKNGNKVPDSQSVPPTWGFTGKGFRTLFHVVTADEGTVPSHLAHLQHHPQQQQHQPHLPPTMTPVHNMMPMGAHPGHPHGLMGQQGQMNAVPPPPPHLQQQQQMSPAGMGQNNGQGFYLPYGAQGSPYRFQGGQQPMQQMPAGYGHYLPFSPPMPPSAPPVYSPQMGNMFPHNASMHHNLGMPPGQVVAPMSRNGGVGAPMQGKVPPHMYYANAAYPPNSAGPMSPNMRHQQPHHQPPHHQQQSHPQSHQQQQQQQQQQQPQTPQTVHSGTPSQSGSVNG